MYSGSGTAVKIPRDKCRKGRTEGWMGKVISIRNVMKKWMTKGTEFEKRESKKRKKKDQRVK